MHDIAKPNGKTLLEFIMEELLKLMERIMDAQKFWSYVMLEWVPKCEMWVMGNRNFPYVGQDINYAIESYHANLKATLRVAKS
jgi:hypothetical protein